MKEKPLNQCFISIEGTNFLAILIGLNSLKTYLSLVNLSNSLILIRVEVFDFDLVDTPEDVVYVVHGMGFVELQCLPHYCFNN